jgi:serine/threonine protein kinase
MPLVNAIGQEYLSFKVSGSKFEVPAHYTVLEPVGRGAYGVVCSAQNNETGDYCAIKKIENVFEDISFSKRTLRELRILRQLKHENIIDITDIFIPQDYASFSDVYVVSALMETDLTSILRSSQPLNDSHCQFFSLPDLERVQVSALRWHHPPRPQAAKPARQLKLRPQDM